MTINFVLVAIDQIVNNAAKMHYMFGGHATVPLVVRMPGGGGHQLGAQHSQSLEVYFAHVPGLTVVTPTTPADAKGLLKSAIRDDNPVIFIENEALYNTRGEVPEGDHLTSIGKAEVRRQGSDLTIVSHSRAVLWAYQAAEQLAREGLEAEVVDLRTLRPLDMETVLASVRKTNHAIVVEEGWSQYGVSAEIAARISSDAFDYLDAPVARIGGAEVPMPYAKGLEQAAMPGPREVVNAAKGLFARANR